MRIFAAFFARGWWLPIAILAFGSAPLFWAPLGIILISEDSALPRPPGQLSLLLYSWNPLINTGTPYNVAQTAILVFSQQALLQMAGLSMAAAQRLMYVVWFALPGFSIAIMVRALLASKLPENGWRVVAFVAASFYMFNLYLENAWLGFNIAVLAAQATLPAIIALLHLAFERRISMRRFTFLLTPIALWAAAIGVNPPMVLVFVAAILAFVVLYTFFSGAWRSPSALGRVALICALAALLSGALNAFWLLPFIGQIRATTGATITASSELAATWLNGLSSSTSLANVARFRGDWTWYQGWNEPYRAYAENYRTSPVLGVLAWVAPALAILGAAVPGPRIKYFFLLLAAGGLLLSMGTHQPMKDAYLWLVDHVPLFWIVRSPWFKFTLLTTLGYALLMGLGALRLSSWARRAFRVSSGPSRPAAFLAAVVPALAAAANLAYAYPVTTGRVFSSPEQRQFLPPNHMTLAAHALEASQWFDAQAADGRIAALPHTTVWANTWGYVGSAPSLVQIGNTPVIYPFRAIQESLISPANDRLNEVAYKAIYEVTTTRADELFKLMGVQFFNHETDVKYWLYAGDTDSPDWVRSRLALQQGIEYERSFGTWDVYRGQSELPRFYVAPQASLVVGGVDALPALVGRPLFLEAPALVFSEGETPAHLAELLTSPLLEGIAFYASSPEQLALDLIPAKFRHALPKVGTPAQVAVDSNGRYELWLRSRDRSKLPSGSIILDGVELTLAQEANDAAPFWTSVGSVDLESGGHSISGALDETVTDQLVLVPDAEINRLRSQVVAILASPKFNAAFLGSSEDSASAENIGYAAGVQPAVSVRFGQHLPAGERLEDGQSWRWLVADGTEALIATNSSNSPVWTNLLFTVQSHATPRDLYVYLNKVQLFLERIPPGRSVDVFLNNLTLDPGENRFHFYSPFPGTPVGNRQLSFAVREDSLRAGRLRFDFRFETFWEGRYSLELRPYGPESSINYVEAELDGEKVSLDASLGLDGKVWIQSLPLAAGGHKLSVIQIDSEQYFLRVRPLDRGPLARTDSFPLEVVETSPTKHRVVVAADRPGVLVFGESFDPRWTALAYGKALRHLRVNGYANGYVLPKLGRYEVSIYFQPQRLFEWGSRISLATVAILVALGAWTALRRRARTIPSFGNRT